MLQYVHCYAIGVAMLRRTLQDKLIHLFQQFPILSVMGPRQSGKTTLVREAFPGLPYINMEDPSIRYMVQEDPKSFLDSYVGPIIIDEIQHVPELFSYLQVYVDQKDCPGQYVITGSQQFLMNERIAQSLAGRVAMSILLPFSYQELQKDNPPKDVNLLLLRGFYPRVYRYHIEPADFYPSYVQTYIERDVRLLKNINNLSLFQKFLRLCAGRVGQILNLTSLATECGISHVTVREWISLLEASFIAYLLQPYHNNYNKRITKAPKLFFYDTGLVCSLLNIQTPEQLTHYYARGALFENFVIGECMKQICHKMQRPQLYYWHDKSGHEIDLIVEKEGYPIPIEIKSSKTIHSDYFKHLHYWNKLTGGDKGYLIFAGEERLKQHQTLIIPWHEIDVDNF